MKNDWFKHLQKTSGIWVDPEQERKAKNNDKIFGWGLGIGIVAWILLGLAGSGASGFFVFLMIIFGAYMLTED